MNVVLGADHAATVLKEGLKVALQRNGHIVEDVSPTAPRAGDDYPDYAFAVAERVAKDPDNTRGILACDTGIGMAIAANKVPGVRAAQVTDEFGARRAREHNDANVLVFGTESVTPERAAALAEIFLTTPFSAEERHARRVRKIIDREDGRSLDGTGSGHGDR